MRLPQLANPRRPDGPLKQPPFPLCFIPPGGGIGTRGMFTSTLHSPHRSCLSTRRARSAPVSICQHPGRILAARACALLQPAKEHAPRPTPQVVLLGGCGAMQRQRDCTVYPHPATLHPLAVSFSVSVCPCLRARLAPVPVRCGDPSAPWLADKPRPAPTCRALPEPVVCAGRAPHAPRHGPLQNDLGPHRRCR